MRRISRISEDSWRLHRLLSLFLRRWAKKGSVLCLVLALALCSYVISGVNTPLSSNGATSLETRGTAVVIDAGSTGSRLYVYTYTYVPAKGAEPQRCHLQIDMPAVATKRISPGIAAFAEQVFMESRSGVLEAEVTEEDEEATKGPQTESALSGEQFHSDAAFSKTFSHYMNRLRRVALNAIPDPEDQRRALIVFRGTAGMRALPEEQQESLLKAVCINLKSWGLRYLPGKSCGVLSGHEEGALGWLALNQLLGRMPEELSMVKLKQQLQFQSGGSGAMIEMGGASVQVVFELPLSTMKRVNPSAIAVTTPEVDTGSFLFPVEGQEDLKILRLRGKPILLFTKSYLGLGRQLALVRVAAQSLRKHYDLHASHLEEKFRPSPSADSLPPKTPMPLPSSPHYEAPLPCFPHDVTLSIDFHSSHFVIDEFLHDDANPVKTPSGGKRQKCLVEGEEEFRKGVSWDGLTSHLDSEAVKALAIEEAKRLRNKHHTRARGVASFEGCRRDISSSWAEHERLPFDLPKDMQLYGTENFFHFNEYVVQADSRPSFSISSFRHAAEHLCALPKIRDVLNKIHPSAAAEKAQTGCFGLVLMSQFLEDVLRLDEHRELLAVNEINGIEVSWTAGILFVMLPDVLDGDNLKEAAVVQHDEL